MHWSSYFYSSALALPRLASFFFVYYTQRHLLSSPIPLLTFYSLHIKTITILPLPLSYLLCATPRDTYCPPPSPALPPINAKPKGTYCPSPSPVLPSIPYTSKDAYCPSPSPFLPSTCYTQRYLLSFPFSYLPFYLYQTQRHVLYFGSARSFLHCIRMMHVSSLSSLDLSLTKLRSSKEMA